MAITTKPAMPIRPILFMLSDDPERPGPTRFREEIRDEIRNLLDAIDNIGSTVLVRICLVGPVNYQSLPHDKFARHETPVAAVGTVIAVVPHSEVMIRRHDDLTVFRVFLVPVRI